MIFFIFVYLFKIIKKNETLSNHFFYDEKSLESN